MTKRRRDLDFPFDKVREEAADVGILGEIGFEECGFITNLRISGCNFTLIWVSDPKRRQEIVNMARALGPIGVPEGKA